MSNNHDKAVLFDLDGVLVDSADCHYRAWKVIADKLGILFDEERNHRLRGVSRRESMLAMIEGQIELSEDEIQTYMTEKNDIYKELLEEAGKSLLLPGAVDLLDDLKKTGVRMGIGSSSRNAYRLLELTDLDKGYFDVVIGGQDIENSKPHPEVFALGAERLGIRPENTLVVEDAPAGTEAARQAGMRAIGVGPAELGECALRVNSVGDLSADLLLGCFQ